MADTRILSNIISYHIIFNILGTVLIMRCIAFQFGLREIKNRSFDLRYPHFPVIPYGRYLFTLSLTKDNETVGLGVAESDVVPRLR